MSCFHPRRVIYTGRKNPETGSNEIIFVNSFIDELSLEQARKKYPDLMPNSSMCFKNGHWFLVKSDLVPCGRCDGCKISYAKDWASRCLLEASFYDSNYFLTITYDDEHIKFTVDEMKRDLQLFIKRLRDKLHYPIRYFGCIEFGSKTYRIHSHFIMFGLKLDDLVRWNDELCTSKFLDDIWCQGNILIGNVTQASCSYVARYCMKKSHTELKECLMMSRKPGIGLRYFDENSEEILKDKKIYFNNGKSNMIAIPRYFKRKLKEIDEEKYNSMKAEKVDIIEAKQELLKFNRNTDKLEEALEYDEDLFKRRNKDNRAL